MQVLISDKDKIIFAEVSRMEAEEESLRFYGSCNDNLIASISFKPFEDYSAEKQARFALLYLADQIGNKERFGAIRSDHQFYIDEEQKICVFKVDESAE